MLDELDLADTVKSAQAKEIADLKRKCASLAVQLEAEQVKTSVEKGKKQKLQKKVSRLSSRSQANSDTNLSALVNNLQNQIEYLENERCKAEEQYADLMKQTSSLYKDGIRIL